MQQINTVAEPNIETPAGAPLGSIASTPEQAAHEQASKPAVLRPIGDIIRDLSKELADRHIKTKTIKGQRINFITWYHAVKYLDLYAPGWSGEVRSVTEVGGRVIVVYRLSIPALEGVIRREATGQESDWDEEEETKYGDPSSNAEAMAFKRAAAKFGLGLYLYDRKK
ncbi:MAG: hypothetical protein KF868_04655 [Acidobacteria bacterium]|nr:hypothetical protein [Acidobacteriota bacterium]MCW5970821.1 hypothetical protein [Blastocatellales bacterium]